MSTRQEIFNKVYAHSLTLRKPVTNVADDNDSCAYRSQQRPTRSAHNRCCLIGSLIADEHYDKSIENKLANEPEVLEVLRKSGIKDAKRHANFLGELQVCHDSASESNFKISLNSRLRQVADTYKLKVPE